jgi:hypothetical protein
MMLRILLTIVVVGILAILSGFALTWRPAIAPISADATVNTDHNTIDQGAELASIGNCSDSHTAEDAASYAGDRPVPTPFTQSTA